MNSNRYVLLMFSAYLSNIQGAPGFLKGVVVYFEGYTGTLSSLHLRKLVEANGGGVGYVTRCLSLLIPTLM